MIGSLPNLHVRTNNIKESLSVYWSVFSTEYNQYLFWYFSNAKQIRNIDAYPVAVVGAYQPGCRLDCVGLPACCGVLGISLPLANTGVSGKEHDVCIPEPVLVTTLPPVCRPLPLLLLPEEHASADGECLFVNGRRRDGPGKSVGRVLRSTGTWRTKGHLINKNKKHIPRNIINNTTISKF